MIPICQKFINAQAYHVLEMTRTMNVNYKLFFDYNTCNRIIWTQGINHVRKKGNTITHHNQQCISFANKLHIDKCDVVKSETSEEWFNWLQQLKD